MNQFTKKQKIILGILVALVIGGICYYVYIGERNYIFEEQNLEITEASEVDKTTQEIKKETIKVHVSGSVQNQGVIELDENSRIVDAIEKAGGVSSDAYIDKINLAYVVEDGMKLYIPNVEEKEKVEKSKEESGLNGIVNEETDGYIIYPEKESSQSKDVKVNINTATQTVLETLPGIGPSIALKIINYRADNGKFESVDEIKGVSGIGENKFEQIKGLICI